jgi:uncharacterized membrane protein YfcA
MLLGGLVGSILGITGAGGSIIAVPLLIFGLQLSAAQAAPIALFAVAMSSVTGALIGFRQQQVRYRAASLIAITGVCAAPLGVWAASKIPNVPLTVIFAMVLMYLAIRMLGQPERENAEALIWENELSPCQVKASGVKISWTMRCARALAYTGTLAGVLSGLLGVGGGFVIVPALKKYSNLGMAHILPTSLSVIALISTSGIVAAIGFGHLDYKVALPFATGAMLGMLISINVGKHFSVCLLQRIFASFSILVAIGLIVKVMLL